MDIQFIASIAVITLDPQKSRELFIDALGLPLEASPGSDYFHSERVDGSKHFGVWPLSQAAQACFGTPDWPADRIVPQMSLEFEVRDADAVQSAAAELRLLRAGIRPLDRCLGSCAAGSDAPPPRSRGCWLFHGQRLSRGRRARHHGIEPAPGASRRLGQRS